MLQSRVNSERERKQEVTEEVENKGGERGTIKEQEVLCQKKGRRAISGYGKLS